MKAPAGSREARDKSREARLVLSVARTALLGAAAMMSVLIMLCATRWGAGIGTDSVTYLGAAQSLLAGGGFCYPPGQPVTHYPPLYSLALALVGWVTGDVIAGARVLQVLLYVANILLAGWIVYRAGGRSFAALLLTVALLLTSPTMLNVHSMALSEGLFLLLGLGGFVLLSKELAAHRPAWLIGSALLLGLSVLTRYVGAAFLAAGVLALLLWSGRRGRARIADALLFGMVGAAPAALWLARNLLEAGSAVNRQVGLSPVGLLHGARALGTIAGWFHTYGAGTDAVQIRVGLAIVLAAAVGYVVLYFARRVHSASRHRGDYFPGLVLVFIPVYVLALAAVLASVDPSVTVGDRALSPVYVFGVTGIMPLLFGVLGRARSHKLLEIAVVCFCAGLAGLQADPMSRQLRGMYAGGRQYASREWKASELVARVRQLPLGTPIYSNGPDAIYILTGRHVSWVPRRAFLAKDQVNPAYESQVAAMMDVLEAHGGVIVCFRRINRWYLPSADQLLRNYPVRVKESLPDGVILEVSVR
ncbi:MAG: glycosyltransferase family 39 protein [Verrucomicrobiota bacterium]